mmetsp:Transcript_27715/g.60685  ORF Transcript_27715/g.60685 Transcript_27715/m.60685 type:complete len:104 (-) Transcript_27715:2741-3052(-)
MTPCQHVHHHVSVQPPRMWNRLEAKSDALQNHAKTSPCAGLLSSMLTCTAWPWCLYCTALCKECTCQIISSPTNGGVESSMAADGTGRLRSPSNFLKEYMLGS